MTNTGNVNLGALGQEILDRVAQAADTQRAQDEQAAQKVAQEAAQARLDRAVEIFCQVTGTDEAAARRSLPDAISEKGEVIFRLPGYRLSYLPADREAGLILRGQSTDADGHPEGVLSIQSQRVSSLVELGQALEGMRALPQEFTTYSNGQVELAVSPQGMHRIMQNPRYDDYKPQE